MNKENIKAIIDSMVDFPVYITKICTDEDDICNVVVEVDRENYAKTYQLEDVFDEFIIKWKQKTPNLLPANVGDIVLIYDKYKTTEAESDVGIVSAKYTKENGDIYYGCRHLKISLNNTFAKFMYDFELTEENYGGYPVGFLKIITPQEFKDHVRNQLNIAFEEQIESTKKIYNRSISNLDKLADFFTDINLIKSEEIDFNQNKIHSISIYMKNN